MRKDLLVTIGGVAAAAAIVFGGGLLVMGACMPSGAPLAPAPHELNAQDQEKLQLLRTQYDSAVSRGQFEEARASVLEAVALCGEDDPQWRRRKADADFYSEDLPAQLRYEQACAGYTALAANTVIPLPETEREWAQFQCGVCLYRLGRFPEALQAVERHLRDNLETPRRGEAQLLRAQCLLGLGQRDEARQELKQLAAESLTDTLKARVSGELKHLEPDSARAEIVPLAEPECPAVSTPGEAERSRVPPAKKQAEQSTTVDADWRNVVQAVRGGDPEQAGQLMEALARRNELSGERRTQLLLDYANMLRELRDPAQRPGAAESGPEIRQP